MKFSLKRITFIFSALITLSIQAQEGPSTCSQNLKKAQDTYDEGRINEVSDLLMECLVSGFTKDEKSDAYKLLTLTYLFYNERGKAENSMLEFLKLKPEYEIDSIVDPIEFINLYNTFRTRAIYNLGIVVGISGQDVDLARGYSVENTNEIRGKYSNKIGYRAAIALEITRWKKSSIYTELVFSQRRYSYEDTIMDYSTLTMTEVQTTLDLPVLFRKNFGNKKNFKPYFDLGGTFHYLLSSRGDLIRKDNIEGISRELKGEIPEILKQRHQLNYSLSVGAGLKLKNVISNGYIVFDVRYNYGLRNWVKPDTRNDNQELIYDFMYVASNYRMNTLTFSIGYIMPKYKPKLKKVKPNNDTDVITPKAEPVSTPETK